MKRKKMVLGFMIVMVAFLIYNINAFAVQIGVTYYKDQLVQDEYDSLFGFGVDNYYGPYGEIEVCTNTKKKTYQTLDKYECRIFEYEKPLEAAVVRYNSEIIYLSANNSMTYTTTMQETEETTYETLLKRTQSNIYSTTAKVDLDVYFAGEKYEVGTQAIESYEESVSFAHSYKRTNSTTITINVPARDRDTYWNYEIRARYKVYKAYIYECSYYEEVTKHNPTFGKKYETRTYTLTGYNLVDIAYLYALIENSTTCGLYEYASTPSGGYVYVGPRYNYITYLD